MRRLERLFEQGNNGAFLVTSINDLGITGIFDELGESSHSVRISALGIDNSRHHRAGGIETGHQDGDRLSVIVVADKTVVCNE